MAQPDLIPFTRRALLLKLRPWNAIGTPSTPAATDVAILYNGQSGTGIDVVDRLIDRPFFGGAPFGVANKRAFIEGEFEIFAPKKPGQATNGLPASNRFLLPAGLTSVKVEASKITRYNPVSNGVSISDAWWYHGGTLKKVQAARHALNAVTLEIGKNFKANVRIEGDYEEIAELPVPTLSLPAAMDVVIASAGNTTANIQVVPAPVALPVWAKSMTVDLGNQIARREYTSHLETSIAARQPTWTMRLAATSLADFNPWRVRDAGTPLRARFRLNEGNNIYSEMGIRGQIEQINEIDIDGDYGWELSGRCIPTSSGGDEFYLEFGDTTP